MAATACCPGEVQAVDRRLADLVASLEERGLNGSVLMADGRCYHEAGATEAQELAAVLATGVAYLRALQQHGIPLDTARRAIAFQLAVDADQFLGIAKLRALRCLWSRIEEACGLAPKPIRLHAESAWRMFTQRDPWVNILRVTMATFSAGIGGADVVTALPFSSALGLPDGFCRRVARNLQLILIEEAHLGRVADPVSGAGGFEALTDGLAGEAWRQFQAIEHAGGMLAVLRSGMLQSLVARAHDVRAAAVATRRLPITGTSTFPDINEQSVPTLMAARFCEPTSLTPWPCASIAMAPLPSRRLAEPFERLRDAADRQVDATGRRRRIFLAPLGPVAAYSERAIFAKNAFEALGVEAVQPEHGSTALDLAAAFLASGASMACLCSSDTVYQTEAASAAQELRQVGAAPLFLCGPRSTACEQAGVTHFIEQDSDLLALLPTG
jgi:methylmalonyl-CoA mutase